MSRLFTFLIVMVVLAIVQAAVAALLVGLAVLVLCSFIARPRQALVFVGTLTAVGLATAQPIAFIFVCGVVALAGIAVGVCQKSHRQPIMINCPRRPSRPSDR